MSMLTAPLALFLLAAAFAVYQHGRETKFTVDVLHANRKELMRRSSEALIRGQSARSVLN